MPQLPSAGELVAAAKAALNIKTDDELRDALRVRYGLRPTQSVIYRWRTGETAPGYQYAVALIDAAGWLNMSAGRPKAVPAPDDPLATLAVAVGALEHAQAEVLAEVRALRVEREAAPLQQ